MTVGVDQVEVALAPRCIAGGVRGPQPGGKGAYLLAGQDAGVVETAIDGVPFSKKDLFHHFSKGLHYPRMVLFATDLKPGPHTLKLRTLDQRNLESKGNAVRILQFVAN